MNGRTVAMAGMLLLLLGCNSPLDIDTKRIDTQLTNRIKLRDITVSARIAHNEDTLTIEQWDHQTVAASLAMDTAATGGARLWLRQTLRCAPADSSKATWLKELVIRLDDVQADGTVTIAGNPIEGTGASATVVVDGDEYGIGAGYNANGVFHFIRQQKQALQGNLVIGSDRMPAFSLLLTVNISASQD